MNTHKSIALPAAEYERLQRLMLTMIGSRNVLASVLRRKLGSSLPATAERRDDTALSGSEVHYVIDGVREGVGTLTWHPGKRGDGTEISLQSPRGLALLGLQPGDNFSYVAESGALEFIEVKRVARKPVRVTARRVPATTSEHIVRHHAEFGGAFAGGVNA